MEQHRGGCLFLYANRQRIANLFPPADRLVLVAPDRQRVASIGGGATYCSRHLVARSLPFPAACVGDSVPVTMRATSQMGEKLSGDTNSDPLPPVLIPTPIMPSCYRLSTPLSGSFLVFTSVSRWVCSGSMFVNLDRINPLLRFSRRR